MASDERAEGRQVPKTDSLACARARRDDPSRPCPAGTGTFTAFTLSAEKHAKCTDRTTKTGGCVVGERVHARVHARASWLSLPFRPRTARLDATTDCAPTLGTGDVNGDGWIDVLSDKLYLNNGDGTGCAQPHSPTFSLFPSLFLPVPSPPPLSSLSSFLPRGGL